MKFINKQYLASLLLILVLNSQIILSNVKINRSNKSNKYLKSKKICEDITTFNYAKFFITAIKRASKSFVSQVSESLRDITGLDNLNKECSDNISKAFVLQKNILMSEKETLMNQLQVKYQEAKNVANQQGLSKLQIEKIQSAVLKQNPQAICYAFRDSIRTNTNSSSEEGEGNQYQSEVLRSLISKAQENGDKISKEEVEEKINNCTFMGITFTEKCRLKRALWDFLKEKPVNKGNFYDALIETYSDVDNNNEFSTKRASLGKKYIDIKCDELPKKEGENDLCVKSTTIINIKALWKTIISIKSSTALECVRGFILDSVISKIFESLVDSITTYLTDIFGFGVFRAIKLLWNIGVIVYYLYKAIKYSDNVDLKSEYWGEVAGASIRIVIDLLSRKHKKLHRHKK